MYRGNRSWHTNVHEENDNIRTCPRRTAALDAPSPAAKHICCVNRLLIPFRCRLVPVETTCLPHAVTCFTAAGPAVAATTTVLLVALRAAVRRSSALITVPNITGSTYVPVVRFRRSRLVRVSCDSFVVVGVLIPFRFPPLYSDHRSLLSRSNVMFVYSRVILP